MPNVSPHSAEELTTSFAAQRCRSGPEPLDIRCKRRQTDRLPLESMMFLPMLPVSGAEQFIPSEPMCPNRPMISAITAYYSTYE